MRTIIIGGGVIGLFSAYYLTKNGHNVTIIEQTDGQSGCSTGNAGMIVPSHFIPLAAPGMIAKGIRWMFDAQSPFYVKPRLDWGLISWGLDFYKAANQKAVDAAAPVLRDISWLSKKLYQELSQQPDFDFCFEEKGLMMLCKTAHNFDEEAHVAQQANDLGIKAKVLTINELHSLEPEVKPDVAGAILYPEDAHLYPNELVENLKKYLANRGTKFCYGEDVQGFEFANNKISKIITNKNQYADFEQVVLATGSWSGQVGKALKLRLPVQAGKGYSVTNEQVTGKKLNIPSILLEARVAITPMSQNLIRFGGTMEIGGLNHDINMNRVKGIIKAVPEFFPDYPITTPQPSQVWHGLRPCSPDGLPYIGRSRQHQNLIIATGHAMMGLSLAPATGKLVSEVVDNHSLSMNIEPFEAERY